MARKHSRGTRKRPQKNTSNMNLETEIPKNLPKESPLYLPAFRKRVLDKVVKIPNSTHWDWTGGQNINYQGKKVTAAKAVYIAVTGLVPNRVRRVCRCKGCVNPKHIRAE